MPSRLTELFCTGHLNDFFESQSQIIENSITSYSIDDLLNTSDEDLLDYFCSNNSFAELILDSDNMELTTEESTKRRRVDSFFSKTGREELIDIPAMTLQVHIPFLGLPELLRYRPSSYSYGTSSPPLSASNNEIIIELKFAKDEADGLKTEIDRQLSFLKRNIHALNSDIDRYNTSLRKSIHKMIMERKNWVLKSRNVVEQLDIPIRKRHDEPVSYPIPVKRKQVAIQTPRPSSTKSKPEPFIKDVGYEQILDILRDMVTAMERSPRTFSKLKEEEIRDLILVWLNAIFEGQAGGELFNFEGKTDILIRVENKNVFIAECKNWKGPKSLADALDQLLGYATWRDTKIALLIFNRRKNLTDVLNKIPDVIREHVSFKKEISRNHETEFGYIVSHRDDPNRELKLTVMVFEVPSNE